MSIPPTPIVIAEFCSTLYWKSVALRQEVLRDPLGMKLTPSDLLGEGSDYHVVALIDNQVVACLVLTPLDSGKMKMRQVATNTSFRRQGLATQLINASETLCREIGVKEIVLNARDYVLSFYENLGYSVEGEGFMEVGIPHHAMRKQVAGHESIYG